MVIISCIGGLGNQMFQYAVYKCFIKKEKEVYMDISSFKNYNLHNGYELENIFNLNIKYANRDQLENLKIEEKDYIKKIIRKITPSLSSHKIIDPFKYEASIFDLKNSYLDIYGQNIEYINMVKKEVIKDFTLDINDLDIRNKEIIKEMESEKNSVAIHIRRGDYVSDSEAYKIYGGICEAEYYNKAIQIIEEKLENPKYYIFSNDIKWAKSNIHANNSEYINFNSGKDSYKDLILMTKCKHNIIANSTFSWWGAWLNQNDQKVVIMPRKWTNQVNNPLVYDSCILL